YSSAVVKAIAEGTITWERDPDFGYEVASALPGIDDMEILQPRRLYERQGRMDEYNAVVEKLRRERQAYLAKFAGLRQEILDALPVEEETGLPFSSRVPGVMHACGHDGHTAALLGAAAVLAERAAGLPGRVILLFQPAEETGEGARAMLEGGVLDGLGVERVAGLHLSSNLPTGLVMARPGIAMATFQRFTIRLRGTGGHAALAAGEGNVVLAAAETARRLPALLDGLELDDTPCVCGVGVLRAGTVHN